MKTDSVKGVLLQHSILLVIPKKFFVLDSVYSKFAGFFSKVAPLFKWLYYQLMDTTLKAFKRTFTFIMSKNSIFGASRIKMQNYIIFSPVLTMTVSVQTIPLQIYIWFLHFNKKSARSIKN